MTLTKFDNGGTFCKQRKTKSPDFIFQILYLFSVLRQNKETGCENILLLVKRNNKKEEREVEMAENDCDH